MTRLRKGARLEEFHSLIRVEVRLVESAMINQSITVSIDVNSHSPPPASTVYLRPILARLTQLDHLTPWLHTTCLCVRTLHLYIALKIPPLLPMQNQLNSVQLFWAKVLMEELKFK